MMGWDLASAEEWEGGKNVMFFLFLFSTLLNGSVGSTTSLRHEGISVCMAMILTPLDGKAHGCVRTFNFVSKPLWRQQRMLKLQCN